MNDPYLEISYYLEHTRLMISEIASIVGCPVELVESIVEQRWNKIMDESKA